MRTMVLLMTGMLVATALVAAAPTASAFTCRYDWRDGSITCSHGEHVICIDGWCVNTQRICAEIGNGEC